jgi:hypothetical protein
MDEPSAQLARIEGKIDLQNEKLETANKINEERHQSIKADIQDLRQSRHLHSNRIQLLEADKLVRDGRNEGVSKTGRLIWAGVSFVIGSGGVFALVEVLK